MSPRSVRKSTSRTLSEALKKITQSVKITRVFEEAALTRVKIKLRHPKTKNIEAIIVESDDYTQTIAIKIADRNDRKALMRLLTEEGSPKNEGADRLTQEFGRASTPLTFQISLKNSNTYLFQAALDMEQENALFDCPKALFLVQRRKFYRFKIPAAYEMWVTIPHPRIAPSKLRVRLEDISMGEIAIEMHHALTRYLKPEHTLEHCTLKLRGQEICFKLVVRSIRKSSDQSKRAKNDVVGCEFKDLPDEARMIIESFMLEQIVQLESGSISLYEGDFV